MLTQYSRMMELKGRGFKPLQVLDIGANIGQWWYDASTVWDVPIVSIEANPEAFDVLKTRNSRSKCLLLGKEEQKNVTLFVNRDNDKCTGASIYLENSYHYNEPNELSLDMVRLDDVDFSEFNLPSDVFDFVKLDVQGAELDILQGGEQTISKASFVLAELSVRRYNAGAPLIDDLLAYMKEKNFYFYDIFEMSHIGGSLVQVDVCFVNENYKHLLEM